MIALFLEHKYEDSKKELFNQNGDVNLIFETIDRVKAAYDFFHNGAKNSVHGVALCEYHLGYIYKTYAEQLSTSSPPPSQTNKDKSLDSKEACYKKAIAHFERS